MPETRKCVKKECVTILRESNPGPYCSAHTPLTFDGLKPPKKKNMHKTIKEQSYLSINHNGKAWFNKAAVKTIIKDFLYVEIQIDRDHSCIYFSFSRCQSATNQPLRFNRTHNQAAIRINAAEIHAMLPARFLIEQEENKIWRVHTSKGFSLSNRSDEKTTD